MPSSIDSTKPADGIAAVKSDLRANLNSAKSEIEALQTDVASVSRLTVSTETAATVTLEDADERNYLLLNSSVAALEVPDALSTGVLITGVNETGGSVSVAVESGGSTTLAGTTTIPDDKPFSLIKTAALKVRVIVGG